MIERHEVLASLERIALDHDALFAKLRALPVDSVGELLMHVPGEFPNLQAALPAMAADEIQVNWTGSSGYTLLKQSCAIARVIETAYLRFAGRDLSEAKILDFGCGWGRLIRLMYAYARPENIFGCDPWERSLEICRSDSLRAHLALSDYLPRDLPFPEQRFDLIYAFSVFTHLSERAAFLALNAIRRSIGSNGLLVLTIRPNSYWEYHDQALGAIDRNDMQRLHADKGFAFAPHQREAVDGDITYGDTSISMDYIKRVWTQWQVVGSDALLQDPFQSFVFLKPIERI